MCDWGDGSVIEHLLLSQRNPVQFPSPTGGSKPLIIPVPGVCNALSWLPWSPGMQVVHINTCMQTYMQVNTHAHKMCLKIDIYKQIKCISSRHELPPIHILPMSQAASKADNSTGPVSLQSACLWPPAAYLVSSLINDFLHFVTNKISHNWFHGGTHLLWQP